MYYVTKGTKTIFKNKNINLYSGHAWQRNVFLRHFFINGGNNIYFQNFSMKKIKNMKIKITMKVSGDKIDLVIKVI